MKRVLTFLREFRDNFHLTGSLLPSSRFLAAALADHITISASGDGAEEAVAALSELVEARFHEAE